MAGGKGSTIVSVDLSMTSRIRLAAALVAGLALQGCASAPEQTLAPQRPTLMPAAYPVDRLVGTWGIASFREERDRRRTEAMARLHCRTPYVITRGPSDGVMMHVADDAQLYELTLKGAADGKTYLGFGVPSPHEQDREIVSLTDNEIVMRFVAPDVHTRYGTFVYLRCPSAPATAARRS